MSDPSESCYAESAAPPALRAQLQCSWQFRQSTISMEPVLILPDGSVDLIWDGTTVFVAGPDRTAAMASPASGSVLSGVRLAAGTAAGLLKLPLHAIADQRVALESLWGVQGRTWQHRLEDGADPLHTLHALCQQHTTSQDQQMAWLFDQLAVGRPMRLAELTQSLGISERSLRRRCQNAFGYGSKTLERILRLQRFLRIARQHRTLTDAALDAGYGDAPHLVRDARQLSGLSPRVLVRQHAR
ncbi:helix-turn-helix domain-containing protein [Xanthomonas hortorum]|uniref:Helix-turn-helix domain-containing protein n=1 Tax=Xanthomonas hortorum pv. hederae TaxID=453603 RepID=A0A9X3YZF0_9XANT|nr:helix-turn-helix domain-containing protein [Xanthomonas hortorum]MCE4370414.1 helix-turn-helix domain-containing protein [Xanthomonas hortorum pv. hederae]MDC8637419.1 helix-turn-helix domain-containing protein [Xanthomonas hortorum pv. hederae]PPU84471.1 AraC family transcriptional regulator [Xanthomonas hortorum pv. hederae]PUF00908.1 AraC family transcriptional regulator [Xanthomonas hortorum pv. hederae]